jgi:tripartite ATP-independent transporter DctM subunit
MTAFEIGIIGIIVLFILLATSLPVGFAMAAVGTAGFALIVNPQAALSVLTTDIYQTFSSYSLTVIPLFVFMGQIAFHSGISSRLFNAAYHWLGPLPGGLAVSTVGACAAFGAVCGSGPATAATMASVALPEMKKYRYSMELATGTVAAAGGLGMLIPPSVVFIVYGIMTEQSVGRLFLAGVLPGLLIALFFGLVIYLQCRRNPQKGPTAPSTAFLTKLKALNGVLETIILFVVVMGGMFAGFFTPTEAASIGAFGALLIALVRRKLTVKMLMRSLFETLRTSCMVLVIVAGAVVLGHFLAVSRIPYELASFLSALPLPPWAVMGFIIVFFLIMGCFVDALALILLTIPIFYPVVLELGYDPIWFGVMIVVVTQMGVISPPVGVNVYIVSGIERDVPLQTVFKGALPFLAVLVFAAALFIVFPDLALLLPNLFSVG